MAIDGNVIEKMHRKEEIPTPCTEEETEVGMKVVAIMQTITEDLDDSGKRMWGKMLGMNGAATRIRKSDDETD